MTKYYIGYDCGTTGTKVAIYSDDSTLVAEAYRPHVIDYPKPGWAEMDPEQFYRVVKEGINECVRKSKIDPLKVSGISCSGIICGFLPIDKDWNPVGPYICYLDGRAKEEARYVKENLEPVWAEESGNADIGSYMPPIFLKWLINNRKDFLRKTSKVVTAAHYVMGKFAGLTARDAFIDWAHMSGWVIGFDAHNRKWSERQMDILGIPYDLLPEVTKPWDVVGTLTKSEEAAEFLGISINTLYEWVSQKKIPNMKVGKLLKFKRKHLEKWLEKKLQNEEDFDILDEQ